MGKRMKGGAKGVLAEQTWSGRVEGWRASGQTQTEYSAEQGFSVWMLRKWIVKLGSERSACKSRPAMLPIPLYPTVPAAQPVMRTMEREAALEIVLPNGTAIYASGVMAAELGRSIARALRC